MVFQYSYASVVFCMCLVCLLSSLRCRVFCNYYHNCCVVDVVTSLHISFCQYYLVLCSLSSSLLLSVSMYFLTLLMFYLLSRILPMPYTMLFFFPSLSCLCFFIYSVTTDLVPVSTYANLPSLNFTLLFTMSVSRMSSSSWRLPVGVL